VQGGLEWLHLHHLRLREIQETIQFFTQLLLQAGDTVGILSTQNLRLMAMVEMVGQAVVLERLMALELLLAVLVPLTVMTVELVERAVIVAAVAVVLVQSVVMLATKVPQVQGEMELLQA